MDISLESFHQAPVTATIAPPAAESARINGHVPKKTDNTAAQDPIMDSAVMILDDEPYNVMVVRKYLRDAGYSNLLSLTDSSEALKTIAEEKPKLLLLDIMMPKVSGLDILRALRLEEQAKRFPVLVLTASTDAATKREALDLGAVDFLPKPVDPNDLIPRVRNALTTKVYEERLARYAEKLEQDVRKRTAELAASREEVIRCLARAAEYRDDITGHHVVRVGRYAGIIASELGFGRADVEMLELAAQLHDVGKIGIPDAILNSQGKLDPEQFAVMQRHCSFAKKILTPLAEHEWRTLRTHSLLGASMLESSSSPILMLAARIAQTHHEWWNGKGYPLGLAGEDIPLEGRITAVADVFDALSTPRTYKAPIPREKSLAIMSEDRGTHFDPRVLDAFFARSKELVHVQMEYMDP
ncbi:MAG: HD domain-containing phosphohydrolase [Thermoguttaceae bacterium]